MGSQTEEGVITFAQIWRVVKKSFARALIYVLVCAILCFAVLFAVKEVTDENTYSARITFNQSDSTIKSTLDSYRATATNNAITEVFGSYEDTTEIYETVLKTLTITAYIPEEYSDDSTYVASSFVVTFDDLDIKDVSSEQQTSLLENICNEFISYYSEINSTDELSETLVWGYTVVYNVEYLDILSELETRLSTLKTSMSANISANVATNSKFATFKSSSTDSNRRTAYEILAQIDNLELIISSLKESVYNNGITNTDATLNGINYCNAKIDSLTYEYNELDAVAQVYETQLANLAAVIENSNSGSLTSSSITIDLSEYTALVEKLVEVKTQMASITTQISEITTFSGTVDPDAATSTVNAANMAATESTINTVISGVTTLIEEYNDLVTEFEENVMPSSYAAVSKPAAAYSDGVISWALLVIIVLAVMVVAYVVAFGQTWSKMKKAGTLDGERALS